MASTTYDEIPDRSGTRSTRPLPGHRDHPLDSVAIDRDAVRAHAGERDVRDALYCLFRPEMAKFVRRYAGWASDGGAWDLDDVWQESFVAFVAIVAAWTGDRGFVHYFYAVFPKRLAAAVRRLDGRLPRVMAGRDSEPAHDPGQAMDARALVASYVAALPLIERQILALHVWEELPFAAVAEHLGLPLTETKQRWRVIRRAFRAHCAANP